MIDHLDIESRIIVAECGEARLQVRRFGLPPLIGDNLSWHRDHTCAF